MDKFLSGFTRIEKSLQIFAIVGVLLLVGCLGVEQYRGDRASAPMTSPAIQK